MPISVPRDRDGSFERELIKKGQTRIDGMDDKIIGLYATGLTVCDIRTHLVRHSLNFCAWKDRKFVAADLRRIYEAATADQAADDLDTFEEKWAGKYASIALEWRRAWQDVIPFFAFVPAIRKSYTQRTRSRALTGSSANQSRRAVRSRLRTPRPS